MITEGPFTLTAGTPLALNDPGVGGGMAKIQIQNQSGFTLKVVNGTTVSTIQSYWVQTLSLVPGGTGVTILPTSDGTAVGTNALTVVWLLSHETPPMADGALSAADIAIASGTVDATITGAVTVSSGTVDIGNTPSVTVASGSIDVTSGTVDATIQNATLDVTGSTINVNGATQATSTFGTVNASAQDTAAVTTPASSGTVTLVPSPSSSEQLQLFSGILVVPSGVTAYLQTTSGTQISVTVDSSTTLNENVALQFDGALLPAGEGVELNHSGNIVCSASLNYSVIPA